MSKSALQAVTAAEAFLTRLGEHGVEYLFGNAGTDFPSIIAAFARLSKTADRSRHLSPSRTRT